MGMGRGSAQGTDWNRASLSKAELLLSVGRRATAEFLSLLFRLLLLFQVTFNNLERSDLSRLPMS